MAVDYTNSLLDQLIALAESPTAVPTPPASGFMQGGQYLPLNYGPPDILQQNSNIVNPNTFAGVMAQNNAAYKLPEVPQDMLIKLIKQNESNGDYGALSDTSTASGAYQYLDSTWNGYGGYARAALAPPEIQDRRFREDLAKRMLKFNGNPFKVAAAHYLPAYANDPSKWDESLTIHGHKVMPISEYVRRTFKGSPLEKSFEQYMRSQQ